MKVLSYNVNGIRAALNKGFSHWLKATEADVVCIQETKALASQVDTAIFDDLGYHHYWFSAQKKGYSGVAILCKKKPNNVVYGSGIDHMDFEGRILRADFDEVSIISLYLPSGTNIARLEYKFQFMDEFQTYINQLKVAYPNLIICGDYNICHQAIDIHLLKYKGVHQLGTFFGEWLAEHLLGYSFISSVEGIIPVPLHPKRKK